MSIDNSIVLEIFKGTSFSLEEMRRIDDKLEKLNSRKGAVILKADEIVTNQYFVCDGCLRTYFVDESGKEHTLQFAVKDWWISDFTAFFTTSRSIMNIECIQDATLYKISRRDMEELYREIPQLETFFRRKMEGAFASFQKRILSSLAQSAKERYTDFINT